MLPGEIILNDNLAVETVKLSASATSIPKGAAVATNGTDGFTNATPEFAATSKIYIALDAVPIVNTSLPNGCIRVVTRGVVSTLKSVGTKILKGQKLIISPTIAGQVTVATDNNGIVIGEAYSDAEATDTVCTIRLL
ncbi:MAG: hypothetical protein LBC12_00455 [Nitrososphaerota archaeon]|jgi:hypothetical protein|nr:hypothetical protein [Nitrososphaerota archaeon]